MKVVSAAAVATVRVTAVQCTRMIQAAGHRVEVLTTRRPVRSATLARLMALLGLALTLLVVGPAAAPSGAQEYGAVCSVAASYDAATETLRVVGTGLQPGFTTPIVLDGDAIGEATADAEGNFEVFIEVELDLEVTHTVSILCNDDGDAASTTVTQTGGRVVHIIEPVTIDCAGNLRGTVEGARRGTDVSITLDHTGEVLAVVTADESGRAVYAVVVDLAPGTYTVTARGSDAFGDPFTITSTFVVPTGCDDLVRTGSDSVPLALAGLGAVGAGSLLVLVGRRRRHATA